jgi:hypothetical protein
MSLKYECNSCGNLAHPTTYPELAPPDDWAHIVIGGHEEIDLCRDCAAMPMRFGNTTYELTPPKKPWAIS